MNSKNFFAELKRRNVYKVALAYAVISWLLIQVGLAFEAPDGVMEVFVIVIAAGFVIALFISWSFEMTPQGMKRTHNISPNEIIPYWSRRKYTVLIVTVALAAGGLLLLQTWRAHHHTSARRAPVTVASLDRWRPDVALRAYPI